MSGLGNEILVVDGRGTADGLPTAHDIARLAAEPQTAFDQLMLMTRSSAETRAARILIYNRDGSAAGACGNGMRCVAWVEHLLNRGVSFTFETPNGVGASRVASIEAITVDMGVPRFDWRDIPLAEAFPDTRHIELQIGPIDAPILHSPSAVNVGNPHVIFWVDDPVGSYDLARIGPLLENHPIFPDRANISLAQVTSRSTLTLRTWERGAGLTRACGSAACAAVVSAIRLKLTERQVRVTLPGGDLDVAWLDDDRIAMTGPVEMHGSGELAFGAASSDGVATWPSKALSP